MTSRPGRVGLSEYTANRLAELRARRAEADMSDGTLGSSGLNGAGDAQTAGSSYSSAGQMNAYLSSSNNNNSNHVINHDRTSSVPVAPSVSTQRLVLSTRSGSTERVLSNGADKPMEVVKPFEATRSGRVQEEPPDEKPPPPPSSPCPDWSTSGGGIKQEPADTTSQRNLFPASRPVIKQEPNDVTSQRNLFPSSGSIIKQESNELTSQRNLFPTSGTEQTRRSPTLSSRFMSTLSSSEPVNTGSASSLSAESTTPSESGSYSQANSTARAVFTLDKQDSSSTNRMRSVSPGLREVTKVQQPYSGGSNQTGSYSSRGATPVQNGFRKAGSNGRINESEADVKQQKHTASSMDEEECLGFASLQEQIQRKAIKKGFDLTIMVVGEAGLGKSTLVTSMFFGNDLYQDRTVPPVQDRIKKTVQIEKRHLEIEERGVKLRVTVVDTPGFNDSLNADKCYKPVVEYIEAQMEQYLKDESGLNRRNIKDSRVHCCLYFISPYGRGLRQIDVEFLKCVHDKVNIVPVIGKADTLTPPEILKLKTAVLADIKKHKIQIYEIPQSDSDDEEESTIRDVELRGSVPFAVIGANTTVEISGRKVKGRIYPWGIVEVENPKHSDFTKLRQFLLSSHMQDLKDVTKEVHYENFRANHIREYSKKSAPSVPQRTRGSAAAAAGEAADNSANTDALLKQKEAEIKKMQEMLARMQAQMNK